MAVLSIQDRTTEFRSILAQAQRKQVTSKASAQRQTLLTDVQRAAANGSTVVNGAATAAAPTRKQRSEFARKAAEIGRGISGTMGKLDRLAQLARRKTLFDDRPVEIAELTFVIKQDLAALNTQISGLQTLARHSGRPGGGGGSAAAAGADQQGEHNKNVVVLLQGRLADVSVNFKDVLELRTKNIQASRSRTENFVSSVSASATPAAAAAAAPPPGARSDSPLYQTNATPQRGRSPRPSGLTSGADVLTLEPADSHGPASALSRAGPASDRQLLLMEEAQPANTYINQRGEAIEAIERTISELGGIFGQLAQMVSEQSEMIQRIDANTEDVVDNVEGAQRELMKYWSRVSGNRWLIAKMFGVLMFCESSREPGRGRRTARLTSSRSLSHLGHRCRLNESSYYSIARRSLCFQMGCVRAEACSIVWRCL